MNEEKKGVKETKEIIEFLFGILEVGKKHVQDGVQPTDIAKIIIEFFNSEEFKEKLVNAFKGITEVPSEIIDLHKPEFFELLMFSWTKLKDLIKK